MSPIVYIIVGGIIVDVVNLDDATVPVYPMLYGYPVSTSSTPDETINFGTKPFHYDPRAILKSAGIDPSALQLGWGARAAIALQSVTAKLVTVHLAADGCNRLDGG